MDLANWIDTRFTLPAVAIPQYEGVDPETAAMGVRTEWGLGERPIKNMIHLLEAHGTRVFSLVEECLAMDAFSFWHGNLPYVCLNTRKSTERSRMDAAHELGHLVMHWKGGARGRDQEQDAQLFGSAFLMPTRSMRTEAPRGGGLPSILRAKERWGVSAANYTYRMRKLGMLTEYQYRALFIEISRQGYRQTEPGGISAETSQVLDKVFKALAEEGISKRDVAAELAIMPDDLNQAIFGLTLLPVDGSSMSDPAPKDQMPERPRLRLVP
jgi:Zn-dependent peptidase ImmA (M78 family)